MITTSSTAPSRPILPTPFASAFALLLICTVERVRTPAGIDAISAAVLVGLCVGLGSLFGGVSAGMQWVLSRAPRAIALSVWPPLCLGLGLWLADDLGAFARWNTPYRSLAIQVLSACVVGALVPSVVLVLVQPTRQAPRGWLHEQKGTVRAAAAVLLLCGAVTSLYADVRYYVGLYPVAHEALRVVAWLLSMLAVRLSWPSPPAAMFRPVPWLSALVLAVVLLRVATDQVPWSIDPLRDAPWSHDVLRLSHRVVDFDGDGYAAWLGGGDCDEWNARVNPGARELPGNGIDDNCNLGDAPVRDQKPRAIVAPDTPSPYDVVLITVDTWRPDHLGLYNRKYGSRGRNTSPNLEAWARDAVVFDRAYSPGGWTSIAIASLMRGRYPRRLAWTRYYETTKTRLVRTQDFPGLEPGETPHQMFPLAFTDAHPTLAQHFRARGMRTSATVYDGFSRMLTSGNGIERDFEPYWEVETHRPERQDDSGVIELARRELRHGRRSPLFLWVHLFGPHSPNQKHATTKHYGPTMADGYDHELRRLDDQLPGLFAAIEARRRPTIVVLTGDHGEVFADPIRMHGFTISEEDLRVPLLIKVPGWQPRRIDQLVSLVDVMPTLLALTGGQVPTDLDGEDLARWVNDGRLNGGRVSSPRTLISDTWRYDARGAPITNLIAAYDGRTKIVLDTVNHSFRRFDQRNWSAPSQPVNPRRPDPLLDVLLRYVEDTGGALRLRD